MTNGNSFNNGAGGYWNDPYSSRMGYPPVGGMFNNSVPQTNVLRVTSLEEAIMRTSTAGSDVVYFHQDKDVFYRIRVDMNGNKTWKAFAFTVAEGDASSASVSRNELTPLVERISELERRLNEMKEEE